MRVLFPLIASFAGAQALFSSLHGKRARLDVCAYIRSTVALSNPITGKPITFGEIDVCACISGITDLIKTNSVLSESCLVAGTSKVTAYVTDLIYKAGKSCTYPDHATPACSQQNPCDFTCTDGYTPNGGECVCKYKECSGQCGQFLRCPSSGLRRRDANEWKKHVLCGQGFTACGVLGRSKFAKGAYECVDVRNNLESCGGCSIPLHHGSPLGDDCTSLPGVAEVSCLSGSCYVDKCLPGYQLAVDNSMCMDDETVEKFITISKSGWEQFVSTNFD